MLSTFETPEELVCNAVQRIPENATVNGRVGPREMKADPDLPRSALIDQFPSQLEGLALARAWGFESPFRTSFIFSRLQRSRSR
jgi:hypothetical protein